MFPAPNNVQSGHINNQYTLANQASNGHPIPNGNLSLPPPPPLPPQQPAQSQRPPPPPSAAKEPLAVVGIPSVSVQDDRFIIGDARSRSTRSYTPLKVVGDGSFGTVWLCDWHGSLPSNIPLSAMQCGAGARPEWAGKRLVAVKRMKKKWEGGWDECKKLKELESLRAIPYHPNIIPLYDAFLLPDSKELYFVFESMEGNLYQLIKSRKGRPLAGGLVSSIFRQVVSGLHHIHASGYFHRDMKPENLLVTTTGLYDYTTLSPVAPPNAPPEKDVVVIVKLADFGLARETKSKPPYTEYVSTRWYRAPEVLLRSRDYSNPVDMWALGTIMAELVNLRPLFPGQSEIDQVARICDLLGDPVDDYGLDARGKSVGGGKWSRGVRMAQSVGFRFPKIHPKDIAALFDRSVPHKLVECIIDLLKYDPAVRLTSAQCVNHPYLLETTPKINPPMPNLVCAPAQLPTRLDQRSGTLPPVAPRNVPPSHSHSSSNAKPAFDPAAGYLQPRPHIPDVSASHRVSLYPSSSSTPSVNASHYSNDLPQYSQSAETLNGADGAVNGNAWLDPQRQPPNGWPMDVSPQTEAPGYGQGQPMETDQPMPAQQGSKIGSKLGLSFKKNSKWSLFGGSDKGQQSVLTPVDEVTPGNPFNRPQSSSSRDSRSLSEMSPANELPPGLQVTDPKRVKKEAERMAKEAEKQRRLLLEKMQREQARAVMQKRNQMLNQQSPGQDLEWIRMGGAGNTGTGQKSGKGRVGSSGRLRQSSAGIGGSGTVGAASGRFSIQGDGSQASSDWRREGERVSKARRREWDDDHSMSSSDVHSSLGRMSVLSFATVDSDPGPGLRHRPSMFGMDRMTSTSSLRTSFGDDFPRSARSSNSLSLEQQLVNEFHIRASVDSTGSVVSPDSSTSPHAPMLSLSPSHPSQRIWQQPRSPQDNLSPTSQRQPPPNFIALPNVPRHPQHLYPPAGQFDFPGQALGHPPSPGNINPIFKVPPLPSPPGEYPSSPHALPPFSHLEAVAEGEYPPLSPMSFTTPEDAL